MRYVEENLLKTEPYLNTVFYLELIKIFFFSFYEALFVQWKLLGSFFIKILKCLLDV